MTSQHEALAQLAEDWCAGRPRALATGENNVHLCDPAPPVMAGGHRFALEFATSGVIGVVATDLSAQQSTRLSQQARDATAPWCLEPFSPGHEDSPAEDLYMCPISGGSMLVVGRLQPDVGAQWQVSITVLGAGS